MTQQVLSVGTLQTWRVPITNLLLPCELHAMWGNKILEMLFCRYGDQAEVTGGSVPRQAVCRGFSQGTAKLICVLERLNIVKSYLADVCNED